MSEHPKDLPRDELIALAVRIRAENPAVQVYFKFTCEKCGERCILAEPNVLFDYGECCECGPKTRIREGGMMLQFVL